jgi:hypothetical protein
MSMPMNALQAGIYTRLAAYTALTTALGSAKIYDHVPQGTAAPYVVIGEDTMVDSDTKTSNGWDCTVTIHCWDYQKAGRKSVKTLMGHIYDALHKAETSITVTGFTLVMMVCDFQQSFQETAVEGAGDHYYHGVQRFRVLITDTTT